MNVLKGGMVGKKNSSHNNSSDPADFSLVLRIANLLNYVDAAKSGIIISLENISSEFRKRGEGEKERNYTQVFSSYPSFISFL